MGTGHRRLLIDTGEGKPAWAQHLRSILISEKANVEQAILTHWHHDHVDGVQDLLGLCPGARVHKHSPDSLQHAITHGQEFCVEGATLQAIHCPGHTVDHVALVLKEEDAMFTGDNVLGHGTAVFEDLRTYLESLEQMRRSFSGRAYPAHGAVIEDGPGKIKEYIKHREQRENQILQTLTDHRKTSATSSATMSPMDLVRSIYKGVPTSLHEAAAGGVRQVLQKLLLEGKVLQSDDNLLWEVADRPLL